MVDFEQRIKDIKVKHKNGEIEKAKAEERIKSLGEQKAKIIEHCNGLGVDPVLLAEEIQKENTNLETMIAAVEKVLGITKEEASPF